MKKNEIRKQSMEKIIQDKGFVHIRELAELFAVSEMTVRRDIYALEELGKVKNVNGIVFSSSSASFQFVSKQYDIREENNTQAEAKSALGSFAASKIEEGDSIFFDVGSTVSQIARYAPVHIKFDAFCLALNSLLHLIEHPKAEVAVMGGYFHSGTQMFVSEEAVGFIRHIRANKLFLSAAGIHENMGISCANSFEVPAKKAMLKSSRQHILVADSSKFGVIRSAYFCDLEEIDEIITDDGLSERWIELIRSKNIKLHLVPCRAAAEGEQKAMP